MSVNNEKTWKHNLRSRLRKRSELEGYIKLKDSQVNWFAGVENGKADYLPFLTTEYYLHTALSSGAEGKNAILRQIIPDEDEFRQRAYELADPLGESKYSPVPRLVHRYADRALILVTDDCAMFCRHCFRRSFTGGMKGPLSENELVPILEYLKTHDGITEILLSGGDPLTLSDRRLEVIIRSIKDVRPDMIIRICSRMPVVLPNRITDDFAEMIGGFEGLWFVTHFNHAAELTYESTVAISKIRKAGVPILNQTVLLGGVNDNIETLSLLFRTLLSKGVKPYYLFQGDLARGTSHLRVPLETALELTAELKSRISGMAMPRFAVDLPGGGGKITLPSECHMIKKEGDFYTIKGLDDEQYRYPAN